MSQIKTFARNIDMKTCYHDIAFLLNQTVESGRIPFTSKRPQGQDTNVISGRHCADINRTTLELKAAAIGATNTMWIFGADAEFLGLELKDSNPKEFQAAKKENRDFNCEPVLMFASVRERMTQGNVDRVNIVREGAGVDVQCAYLLDQFTEESRRRVFRQQKLERVFEQGTVDIVSRRRSEIASQILKNIASYDSLNDEKAALIKANVHNNLTKDGEFYQEAITEYKKMTASFSPAQKKVFDVCRKHYTAQLSGSLLNLTDDEKSEFISSLKELQQKDPEVVARTVFLSSVYAERSTHYGFALEPIYHASEMKQQVINQMGVKDPRVAEHMREAAYDGPIMNENARRMMLNKTHEKIRTPNYER